MKICNCNNCGGIWEDKNPQNDAREYPNDPNIHPLVWCAALDDSRNNFWGCPTCGDDGFLSDGLGIKDYFPENADEGEVCTEDDFIEAAKGNLQYAVLLNQRVEWQWPQTLVEDDLMEGEIIEEKDTYILVNEKQTYL